LKDICEDIEEHKLRLQPKIAIAITESSKIIEKKQISKHDSLMKSGYKNYLAGMMNNLRTNIQKSMRPTYA